jgi:hypothetical protein
MRNNECMMSVFNSSYNLKQHLPEFRLFAALSSRDGLLDHPRMSLEWHPSYPVIGQEGAHCWDT